MLYEEILMLTQNRNSVCIAEKSSLIPDRASYEPLTGFETRP